MTLMKLTQLALACLLFGLSIGLYFWALEAEQGSFLGFAALGPFAFPKGLLIALAALCLLWFAATVFFSAPKDPPRPKIALANSVSALGLFACLTLGAAIFGSLILLLPVSLLALIALNRGFKFRGLAILSGVWTVFLVSLFLVLGLDQHQFTTLLGLGA